MPGSPSVEELRERLAQRDVLIEALRVELAQMRVWVADGHPGSTLVPVAVPDESLRTSRSAAGTAGRIWVGPGGGENTGEVFDISPISVRVIEYQLIKRRCGVRHHHRRRCAYRSGPE
ncbi:MAG: hypothetical protein ACRDRH_03975 [Pseudonocardia sp.]